MLLQKGKNAEKFPQFVVAPFDGLFIRFRGIQIPFIWNTIRLELTSVEWRKGESRSPGKYFHVMPRNGHRPITMSHINCLPLYQSPPSSSFFISPQDNGNADAAKNEFEDPCDSTSVSRSALLFSRTL
ncbi:uncharacterized protein LOC27209296 [Drosophila simulans]|uniref:Uncharacterized protein n=1 Tax=Drosophila simulans TaxID=7240 RepID=A0A0J9QW29_DROSI|nr:uncharacterized protein LOC27209296 [Drosophila simulans]KMY87924.1 uncharacterized protein Dsimw501_GD29453 [Drosophila simulans]